MTHLEDWLGFAHELADLADALTLPAFRGAMDVDTKADGTYVTETDVAVERRLREAIAARYPTHAVLGEEDGFTGSQDRPTWIIDPIDGTNNFVTGNPVHATLICLQVEESGSVAVASSPALGTRWDGMVGPDARRARRDGRAIRVSERGLEDGQVSLGGLRYFTESGQGELVRRLAAATRRQRGFGDFWQHCLVAEGSVEVAVEAAVSAWDLAAVRCIVTAAGGRFSDLRGRDVIDGGSALSTNGRVHDEVLSMVEPVDG